MVTTDARVIDVRQQSDPDRWGSTLQTFDILLPGESLVVVTDTEPQQLLRRLQAQRRGLFEWSPLEVGPSSFRIEIFRRDALLGARREVLEALAWDHDRLDTLERRAFGLLESGDAQGARASWEEFALGLRRHIHFEEEILFPTFEAELGFTRDSGPTHMMREEHREIERLLEGLGLAFAGAAEQAPTLRADLHNVLGEHNLKEESVLYPLTDQRLDIDERDALVGRIQAS